jgi:hypothetical protein
MVAYLPRVWWIMGLSPDQVSPLRMQHKGERAKAGWLGIRIMCLSGRHFYLQTVLSVS